MGTLSKTIKDLDKVKQILDGTIRRTELFRASINKTNFYNKQKKHLHKPNSINEAINELKTFLICDLYSKFRSEKEINGQMWEREDSFINEKEFQQYLEDHFEILIKKINDLNN